MKNSNKSISFSVNAWCNAIGCDAKTILTKLTKAGHKVESHQLVSAKKILDSFAGEKDVAMTRLTDERTLALEQKRKIKDGSLVEVPTAERILWAELLGPLKQELDAMPQKLAQLVNPDEVKQTEKIIFDHVEEIKRKLMKQ